MIQTKLDQTVHIWHAELDSHVKQYKLFQSWLSAEEREKAGNLTAFSRQNFILSRGLLREILTKYTKLPPEKFFFAYTRFGKPLLHPSLNTKIEFNLSHSKNRVIYAFTHTTAVGVDLEYKKARKFIDKIAYRFLARSDYTHLLRLSREEKLNAFFNAWVRYEASLKAAGHPIKTHPFSQYTMHSKQQAPLINSPDYFLFNLAIHPDFSAAVAVNIPIKNILIKNYG
jgi:4'-phosphopantetheinyl transferase